MYLWKCWRDTRSFFVVFLIVGAAVIPVTAAIGVGSSLLGGFGKNVFLPTLGIILFVVALGLGTLSAIREFTDKTAHFLFTKPRSRAYFIWAGWAVGCVELLVIALVILLAGWLTLAHYGQGLFSSALFDSISKQEVSGAFVYTLIAYSLTYALTAVLRNGLKGLGVSMGSLMGLMYVAAWLRLRWAINMPVPPERIGHLPTVISDTAWVLVALLFMLAAQLFLERAEI